MKFLSVPLEQAAGKILGHNITRPDGTRLLRKGKAIAADDVALLRAAGRDSVYVAELDPGDVGEDDAARTIALLAAGRGLTATSAAGGRANLLANAPGVLRVNEARIADLNGLSGVTFATLPAHGAVVRKQMSATVKIIPYAIPGEALTQAREICAAPLVWVDALQPVRATLILSGSPGARDRIVRDFEVSIGMRLSALGSMLAHIEFVPLEDERDEARMAQTLAQCAARGDGIAILAGETAIMDRDDIAPRAIVRAGGEVTVYGAPVDPGNLLLVAYLGHMPILGAPGCVRSRKQNVVDWVLPRLLAGDRLTQRDVSALGVGGLLEEIRKRGRLREEM